jgi:hypothetical protein
LRGKTTALDFYNVIKNFTIVFSVFKSYAIADIEIKMKNFFLLENRFFQVFIQLKSIFRLKQFSDNGNILSDSLSQKNPPIFSLCHHFYPNLLLSK